MLADAERALAAAREDTERYRALRKNPNAWWHDGDGEGWVEFGGGSDHEDPWDREHGSLDALADALRGEKETE